MQKLFDKNDLEIICQSELIDGKKYLAFFSSKVQEEITKTHTKNPIVSDAEAPSDDENEAWMKEARDTLYVV